MEALIPLPLRSLLVKTVSIWSVIINMNCCLLWQNDSGLRKISAEAYSSLSGHWLSRDVFKVAVNNKFPSTWILSSSSWWSSATSLLRDALVDTRQSIITCRGVYSRQVPSVSAINRVSERTSSLLPLWSSSLEFTTLKYVTSHHCTVAVARPITDS